MDTKVTCIDRHDSLRPVGPQATQSLLDEKKIPALQEHEYQQWAEYLFSAPLPLQLQVAETLVRHDRQHSYALFLFLACTQPSAAKFSRRLAYKIFLHPPDLTLELMYDGAMTALMTLLKRDFVLADTSFPVFLFTVIKNGATETAFRRLENTKIPTLGKRQGLPQPPRLEEQLIAKQMLEKIADLEPSPETLRFHKFLRCVILQLGPETALRPSTNYRSHPRPSPIIDLEPVMRELGISVNTARKYQLGARHMLRRMFNPQGTLFTKNRPPSKRR
jgi:hypothetical protein